MRLVRAEVLKIARRRGLMIWTLILTIGAVLVSEVILLILHAANPDHHGPAGGETNFTNYVSVLILLGTVASIMIGATAGSQDVANGVFRDLVVTGRKRATLFNVRVPGVLIVFLPMMLIGFALALGGAIAFAGVLPRPSAGVVGGYAAYALALTCINVILAVSLAAFVSSRIVVGVLIAWNVIVAPLLAQIDSLGSARKALTTVAAHSFAPTRFEHQNVTMSAAAAVAVLLIWAAAFTGAGRWWTNRRDA
jgi:hypothetical protein